jgi:hypothetical protein
VAADDEVTLAKRRVGSDLCGRWPLERLIGFGGMAAVYRSHGSDGTPVAIKILHSTYSTNEGIRQRFVREAQLTDAVDHAGRVAIYEQGESDEGDPYFVMELLEGMTLDKLWKTNDRVLPVDQALDIVDHVLEFLGACHQQTIVHRDLKPANIFITNDGTVKVLDFGVARKREAGVDPTMAGTALGTPAYMAPEQALGSTERIDARTDLFAIGAVLHTMISGKRLHEGRSNEEAFVLAATRPAPSVAKVAPQLAAEVVALIDRALQWDPRNRFQNAAEMREAIAALRGKAEAPEEAPAAEPKRHGKAQLLSALAESAETPAEEQPLTAAEEARVKDIQEVFRRVERGLNAARQYNWEHKVTRGHMETVHEVLSEYLARVPEGLTWEVKPHSFTMKSAVLWEPLHPFDEIPYNLFASGFRNFTISPGVTIEEVTSLLDLMRRDPTRDFSPEDDLATAFWEKQLEHIQYQVVGSFLTVGSSEEADSEYDELLETGKDLMDSPVRRAGKGGELEVEPLSLEERAAAIAARQVALRAVRAAGAASLDEQTRSLIAAALDMPEAEWEQRYVKVLAHAAVDAANYDNLPLVTMPLRVGIHEAATSQKLAPALRRTIGVIEAVTLRAGPAVSTLLTRDLLDAETLGVVLKELARPVPDGERESVAAAAPLLAQLLDEAGAEHFDTMLAALGRADVEPIRDALLRYLERHAVGREEQVAGLLADADLGKGRAILGLLRRIGTEDAARALKAAESSSFAELRVEAIAMRAHASVDGLRDELGRLLSDRNSSVRIAALNTMARYKVKEAGPLLVQLASDDAFHKLDAEERRLTLETLWQLSPVRAESLAKDIAVKSGMITREAVDDTRALCMDLLARLSSNPNVIGELEKTAGKWTNSQMVRDAATQAVASMKRRMGVR